MEITTSTEKQTLRILFLVSDPSNTAKLQLGKELQEVRNRLAGNSYFEIKDHLAVKPDDVLQTILNYKPHIVHFSGHGQETGELCFEDEKGNSKAIPPEALASLFSLASEHVKCVIVNTCYSEAQAKAIAQYIPVVIGTKKEISDTAAIKFSTGFYTALDPDLSQSSLNNAFKRGCIAIQFEGIQNESLIPVLIEGSPEVRFSSEVDTAFLQISQPKGLVVQALIRGLSLTGIKMGLTDEIVKKILDQKTQKLQAYNDNKAEYEKYLKDILRDEFPLTESSTAALLQLQNGLDLSNDDVQSIKNRILLDPKLDSAAKWYDRGRGQSDLGNHKKAIEYYTRAIEKDDDYSGAYYERGFSYQSLQEYELAIDDFSKAIEFNKSWEMYSNLSAAYYSRGHCYFSLQSDDENKTNEYMSLALQDWNKSIELNPNEANAYYNRGLVQEYFNHLEDAIADFKKSLEIDKTNTNKTKAATVARIVRCYSILTKTEEASKWTKIGVELLNDENAFPDFNVDGETNKSVLNP